MKIRAIRITALILLIQTITWVVFMAISTAAIDPDWELLDYVRWASERGVAYVINYVNVSLLTLVAVLLFFLLYGYAKDLSKPMALTGMILVPLYGLINLICYSMQISLVPDLAASAITGEGSIERISRLIQANPDSLVGFLNGLAYAILGVPSILNGILLIWKSKKWSGVLLLISGALSIVGFAGYTFGSNLLSAGTLLGGFAFLLALVALVLEFRPEKISSPVSFIS